MDSRDNAANTVTSTTNTITTTNNHSTLSAALSQRARGWQVIPIYAIVDGVCSCARGAECTSPGKHPITSRGLKDATLDAAKIRRWWANVPNANIAVRTGPE